MRIFTGCIVMAICALLIPHSVSADHYFQQTHHIEIEVECIQSAMEIIRELNGYNLESNVFLHENQSHNPHNQADIVRKVEGWAFRHVQADLRNLGIVHSESERAQSLGSHIMILDTRLTSISQEIDRLTILMAASDTLNLLLTIETRLNQLVGERNDLIGSRNVLISQAENPVITIRLFETLLEPQPEDPVGFGGRVATRFLSSWRGTTSAVVNVFVFLVRVSVPLFVLGLIAGLVSWLHKLGHKWYDQRTSAKPEKKEAEDETDI